MLGALLCSVKLLVDGDAEMLIKRAAEFALTQVIRHAVTED